MIRYAARPVYGHYLGTSCDSTYGHHIIYLSVGNKTRSFWAGSWFYDDEVQQGDAVALFVLGDTWVEELRKLVPDPDTGKLVPLPPDPNSTTWLEGELLGIDDDSLCAPAGMRAVSLRVDDAVETYPVSAFTDISVRIGDFVRIALDRQFLVREVKGGEK